MCTQVIYTPKQIHRHCKHCRKSKVSACPELGTTGFCHWDTEDCRKSLLQKEKKTWDWAKVISDEWIGVTMFNKSPRWAQLSELCVVTACWDLGKKTWHPPHSPPHIHTHSTPSKVPLSGSNSVNLWPVPVPDQQPFLGCLIFFMMAQELGEINKDLLHQWFSPFLMLGS